MFQFSCLRYIAFFSLMYLFFISAAENILTICPWRMQNLRKDVEDISLVISIFFISHSNFVDLLDFDIMAVSCRGKLSRTFSSFSVVISVLLYFLYFELFNLYAFSVVVVAPIFIYSSL